MEALLNPGWIGVFVGILGLAFGVYQVARRTAGRLTYQYLGQRLIEGGGGTLPHDVVVLYKGTEVERVSLSQIAVWNSGQAPIRGEDVVAEDPVGFLFEQGSEILSVEVSKHTRDANKCEASVHGSLSNRLVLGFSFLDRNDGALIRILHTSRKTAPEAVGTIVGIPSGPVSLGRLRLGLRRRNRTGDADLSVARAFRLGFAATFFVVPPLVGLGLLAVALFPNLASLVGEDVPDRVGRLVLALLAAGYTVPPLLVLWLWRRRCPASITPDELA